MQALKEVLGLTSRIRVKTQRAQEDGAKGNLDSNIAKKSWKGILKEMETNEDYWCSSG